jgi:hypothetical protein
LKDAEGHLTSATGVKGNPGMTSAVISLDSALSLPKSFPARLDVVTDGQAGGDLPRLQVWRKRNKTKRRYV